MIRLLQPPPTSTGEPVNLDMPWSQARHLQESLEALRRLVSPSDLGIVFQPIVALSSGAIFAQEALVRCRRSDLPTPPALFERALAMGCVGRLGRAIRDMAVPLAAGARLFVNIHPQELQESWLVRPDDPIYSHDTEIFLEITEAVPLAHYRLCMEVLQEVRGRSGVNIVLDDLGAGYSNLRRISDLAPEVVKLDRGLVRGIADQPRLRRLVSNIVELCTDLSALVVAEGIETEPEWQALSDCGVQYGQGFLFAQPAFPMPPLTWCPPPAAAGRS